MSEEVQRFCNEYISPDWKHVVSVPSVRGYDTHLFVNGGVECLANIVKVLCAAHATQIPLQIGRRIASVDVQAWQIDIPWSHTDALSKVAQYLEEEHPLICGPKPHEDIDYGNTSWVNQFLQLLTGGAGVKPFYARMKTLPDNKKISSFEMAFSSPYSEQLKEIFTDIIQELPDVEVLKRYIVYEQDGAPRLVQYYIIAGAISDTKQTLLTKIIESRVGNVSTGFEVKEARFYQLINGQAVPSGPRNIPSISAMGASGQKGVWSPMNQKNIDIDLDIAQTEITGDA